MTFGPQMKSPSAINNQVKKSGKKLPGTPHLLGPHEIHLKCVNASDYDLNYVQRLLPSALRSFFVVKLEAGGERCSHRVSNSIWGKKKKQHSPTSSLAQDEELWEKVGVWFCSAEVREEVVTGLKSLHYLAWGRNRSPLDFLYAAVPENDCSCSWLSAGISPERGQKHRGVLLRTQTCVPRTRKP